MEAVPIRLNGFEVNTASISTGDLVARVSKHYTDELLRQVYKVLLSCNILGNPIGVVTSLGSGVRDFFMHPIEGAVVSPGDFALGLGTRHGACDFPWCCETGVCAVQRCALLRVCHTRDVRGVIKAILLRCLIGERVKQSCCVAW